MKLGAEFDENYWIEQFREGHDRSLAFFFELYYKPLLFFARQMVCDKDEAEDIVSDCFLKLWQRHQRFDTAQNIKAFLFISCRNSCLNLIQHKKVKTNAHEAYLRESLDGGENVLSLMIKTEVLDLINKEIDQLPQKMGEIFKRMYFEGKNTNEIAEELQLSVQTVRNQKAKAVDLLKTAMLKKGISATAYIILLDFI